MKFTKKVFFFLLSYLTLKEIRVVRLGLLNLLNHNILNVIYNIILIAIKLTKKISDSGFL